MCQKIINYRTSMLQHSKGSEPLNSLIIIIHVLNVSFVKFRNFTVHTLPNVTIFPNLNSIDFYSNVDLFISIIVLAFFYWFYRWNGIHTIFFNNTQKHNKAKEIPHRWKS